MDRLKQGLFWAVGWLGGFWNREAGGLPRETWQWGLLLALVKPKLLLLDTLKRATSMY